jgi:hypothetical protein
MLLFSVDHSLARDRERERACLFEIVGGSSFSIRTNVVTVSFEIRHWHAKKKLLSEHSQNLRLKK